MKANSSTSSARAPKRRPHVGGYARGDETRAQIVHAAMRIFGEVGFELAATRAIAAKAGVMPPALQYYFGSKEGLFRACAQHIIDRAKARFRPALDAAALAVHGSPKEALDALQELLDALTDSLTEPGYEILGRFIGKQDGAGPGLEIIRQQIGEPIINAVAGLVAALTGFPASHESTRLRALLIVGQVNWLYARREEALKIMKWSDISEQKAQLIKHFVGEHTRLALKVSRLGNPARRIPR